ncbi:HPP family protein [Thermodesulfobacteriota bacterium]
MLFGKKKEHRAIRELIAGSSERMLPLIHESSNVEEVIRMMKHSRQCRLLYVVDDEGTLLGTISIGALVRHLFSRGHEPQIHARKLLHSITAETAGHIMQKRPIFAIEDDDIETMLKKMIKSNVKEIAVVDKDKRVIADLTLVDFLEFLAEETEE